MKATQLFENFKALSKEETSAITGGTMIDPGLYNDHPWDDSIIDPVVVCGEHPWDSDITTGDSRIK